MDEESKERWHDLAPGLGLIAGAVLASLLIASSSDGDAGRPALGIAIGAAVGLVIGAIVRLRGSGR